MKKVIVADERRCLACKSCVIECAMAHSEAVSLAEAAGAETPPQARIHVEAVGELSVPLQCRHCENAPCMTVCPTEAISRINEQSPVILNQDSCIGCKLCILVCPFGVIDLSRTGKSAIKCDLCIERITEGDEPACVTACPTRALQYRDIDDWLGQRRAEAAKRVLASHDEADTLAAE